LAGGCPVSARTTRTVIVLDWPLPIASVAGFAVTVMLYVIWAVGGTGGTGSTLGSDGEFEVHAASASKAAGSRTNKDLRSGFIV
jgi:hypothetical protein